MKVTKQCRFQIRPTKYVMSVRWNTLVKILGLYKLCKFHLQLNLITKIKNEQKTKQNKTFDFKHIYVFKIYVFKINSKACIHSIEINQN